MGRNTPGSQVLVAQVSSGPACFSAAGQGHRGANIPVGAAATRLAETATRRMKSDLIVGIRLPRLTHRLKQIGLKNPSFGDGRFSSKNFY